MLYVIYIRYNFRYSKGVKRLNSVFRKLYINYIICCQRRIILSDYEMLYTSVLMFTCKTDLFLCEFFINVLLQGNRNIGSQNFIQTSKAIIILHEFVNRHNEISNTYFICCFFFSFFIILCLFRHADMDIKICSVSSFHLQ